MKTRILMFILFMLIFTSACENTDDPVPILVQNSGTQDVEAYGVVAVEKEVILSVDFPVRVVSIEVRQGQHIEQGQVLATLDLSELEQERQTILREMEPIKSEINRMQRKTADREDLLNAQALPEMRRVLFLLEVQENLKEELMEEYKRQNELVRSGSAPNQTLLQMDKEISGMDTEIQNLEYSLESLKHQLQTEIDNLKEILIVNQERLAMLQNRIADIDILKKQSSLVENQLMSPISRGIVDEIVF